MTQLRSPGSLPAAQVVESNDMPHQPSTARSIIRDATRKAVGPSAALRIATLYDDARFFAAYVGSTKGRKSLRQLLALRGKFAGKRCFIIGNGPSLRQMDLSPLEHEYTFGLN